MGKLLLGILAVGGIGGLAWYLYNRSQTTDTTTTVMPDGTVVSGVAPITLTPPMPQATLTPAFSFTANYLVVTFTNSSTASDGSVMTYSWDFGDGSPISTAQSPVHTYAKDGTYNVKLIVRSANAAPQALTQSVVVAHQPTAADIYDGQAVAGGNLNVTIYLVKNGTKHGFPTPASFAAYFGIPLSNSAYTVISPTVLASIPTGTPMTASGTISSSFTGDSLNFAGNRYDLHNVFAN